jgi:cyclopropane-fatty-acyl-phospholipid synthase
MKSMTIMASLLERAGRRHRGRPIFFELWNGERVTLGQGEATLGLQFRTREALGRSLLQTSLGLGEAYMRGDVVVHGDLPEVLVTLGGLYLDLQVERYIPAALRNAVARSLAQEKADIEHHYGRGNDFYEYYLDKKLQYSCGYFRSESDSLDLAQEQKLAHTVRKLDLRPGQRLLDIGCGWGHLMFHAAEHYGVSCVGITLCDNQASYIRAEAKARNLPVEVRVMNYLELDEADKWDRLVSVGMMCHVGEKNADAFYDKVNALLRPGAVCLLHCISKMRESSGADPFVAKHIFPGYWFFSLEGETHRAVERGLNVMDVENLRRHYAMTIEHWRKSFHRNYNAIKLRMGYDDTFMRMWDFYFASCIAGFRSGYLNLVQMVMSKGLASEYPLTRDFLYAPPPAPSRAASLVG